MDEEAFRKFMIDEKDFSEDILNVRIKSFKQAKKAKAQSSLESFFGKPKRVIHEANLKKKKKKGSKKKGIMGMFGGKSVKK